MELEYRVNPFLFHKDDYDRYYTILETQVIGYQILEVIDEGAFGVVYRARDKTTNEIVAIKDELEGVMSPSALVEIDILKSLPPHPSVVAFKKAVTEGSRLYLVMEDIQYDLKRFRVANAKPYSLVEIKFIIKEILKGVNFLHENGVMHRDLKPSNVLFCGRTKVKICDFGLSARVGSAPRGSVGTSGYRAPEVLVGSILHPTGHMLANTNPTLIHTCAVDMWSVGCMMAEFVLDEPLFRGESEKEELNCIHGILRSPSSLLRLKMATAAAFSGANRLTPLGLDLLERLLEFDPWNRISARDALDHPWFKEKDCLV